MSINSALAAGASGLLANSSALASISDNIANVNTVGYKRVDTVFTPNYKVQGGGEARYASAGVQANTRLDITSEGLLNPASSERCLIEREYSTPRPSRSSTCSGGSVFSRHSGGRGKVRPSPKFT